MLDLEEGQALTDCIAQTIDPKHKYKLKRYKRTCAFTSNTFMHGKHRVIGITKGTLRNHTINGFARVMLHEIAHFVHDQRYARQPFRYRYDLLTKRRPHRKTFRVLEQKLKSRFEEAYGERLPESCWDE